MTGLIRVHQAEGREDLTRAELQKARALLPHIREVRTRDHWRQELEKLADEIEDA